LILTWGLTTSLDSPQRIVDDRVSLVIVVVDVDLMVDPRR